jgi:hypothetical protein
MIRCVSKYSSSLGSFEPGQVIEAAQLGAALMADSPGSFVRVEDEAKVVVQSEDASGAVHDSIPIVSKPARGFRRKG